MKRNTADILLGIKEKDTKTVLTGIKSLDASFGGFRDSNFYIFAGLEKCGKTSFLLNIVSNLLRDKKRITFISTEMIYRETVERMMTIRGIPPVFDDIPERKHLFQEIEENFNFISGVELLAKEGGISVNELAVAVEKAIVEGEADIVFVDNLTTFAQQTTSSEPTPMKIGAVMGHLVNISKKTKTPIVAVVHTKSDSYKEKPDYIFSQIKAGNHLDVFDETEVFIPKPTLSDVYSGGMALSQVTGAILLWRPYQKFTKSTVRGEAALILDSMRYSESGVLLRFTYDGKTGRFKDHGEEDLEVKRIEQIFLPTNNQDDK